jgi:hypothetical protein
MRTCLAMPDFRGQSPLKRAPVDNIGKQGDPRIRGHAKHGGWLDFKLRHGSSGEVEIGTIISVVPEIFKTSRTPPRTAPRAAGLEKSPTFSSNQSLIGFPGTTHYYRERKILDTSHSAA